MIGMFNVTLDPETSRIASANMENKIKEVDQNDPTLEEHWKKEYEN